MLAGLLATVGLAGTRVLGRHTQDKSEAQARCVSALGGADCTGVRTESEGRRPASGRSDRNVTELRHFAGREAIQRLVSAGRTAAGRPVGSGGVQGATHAGAGSTGGAASGGDRTLQPGRRMTPEAAAAATSGVVDLVADGFVGVDLLERFHVVEFGKTPGATDLETFRNEVVTPALTNPLAVLVFPDGHSEYLGYVDGSLVFVDVTKDGRVSAVRVPNDYDAAVFLCAAGRASGCAVRDAMDARSRREIAQLEAVTTTALSFFPVVGTALDVLTLVQTCPADPASFDCAMAVASLLPEVPQIGHTGTLVDETLGATRAARKVEHDAPGSRALAQTPKHAPGGWGSLMPLDDATTLALLNDPARTVVNPNGFQIWAVRDGLVYLFMHDAAGGYHGFELPAADVPSRVPAWVLRSWRDRGLLSASEYEKLRKGKSAAR